MAEDGETGPQWRDRGARTGTTREGALGEDGPGTSRRGGAGEQVVSPDSRGNSGNVPMATPVTLRRKIRSAPPRARAGPGRTAAHILMGAPAPGSHPPQCRRAAAPAAATLIHHRAWGATRGVGGYGGGAGARPVRPCPPWQWLVKGLICAPPKEGASGQAGESGSPWPWTMAHGAGVGKLARCEQRAGFGAVEHPVMTRRQRWRPGRRGERSCTPPPSADSGVSAGGASATYTYSRPAPSRSWRDSHNAIIHRTPRCRLLSRI